MNEKIGIIGYAAKTGIGYLINDYKKFLPIDTHYVISHKEKGIDETMLDDRCVIDEGDELYKDWLDSLKTLIIIETPFKDISFCREKGIKVICSVNIDWFPYGRVPWIQDVKLSKGHFIAPNQYTVNVLSNYNIKAVHIPVSVDTDYFEFIPRRFAEGFVFNNGNGGYKGRKNMEMILRIFKNHNYPIWINSQRDLIADDLPDNIFFQGGLDERKDIYQRGSIYLCPTKWEGHCLHLAEAMATGLVPFVTDGEPMNELQPTEDLRIPATMITTHTEGNFSAVEYSPLEDVLFNMIKICYGRDILDWSKLARQLIMENHDWLGNQHKFLNILD